MRIALTFPGQASQVVGMGRTFYEEFPAAREVFEQADKALGFSITELCFEGPASELSRTEITQPSILTASVAAWAALEPALADSGCEVAVAAGHSLGEYSALVAGGALDFPAAVTLVHHRGRLMQEAVPEGEGAMSAVIGLDAADVEEVCALVSCDGEVVALANYNSPGQLVISGSREGVQQAEKLIEERGAKRVVRLPVSAPFHCPLMKPAAEGMSRALEDAEFDRMRFPLVANSTALPYPEDPAEYPRLLWSQIEQPVRWIETVSSFENSFGAEVIFEVGPGKVLTGLAKRINGAIPQRNVDTVERMDDAIKWMNQAKSAGFA